MKLQMFGTVGRATVPADIGRHGGRPYDSTRPKFLFRFDWTLAARGGAHMKLHKIRGRSKKYLTAEIAENAEKKIINNLCDLCGELLCFFFDLTGRSRPAAALV